MAVAAVEDRRSSITRAKEEPRSSPGEPQHVLLPSDGPQVEKTGAGWLRV